MIRARFALVAAAVLVASSASAQILFQYQDLDPDATSPVNNGLSITGVNDGGRTGVGNVDVGGGTAPFMNLMTVPDPVDVTGFAGKDFEAFAEVYIPSASTINTGDSIYSSILFYNDAVGLNQADTNTFERFNAGFLNDTSNRDEWLTISNADVVPAMTPGGDAVDRAAVNFIFTDGGFGGTPNDSGAGTFALIDNYSFTVSEPPPPNPVFYTNDAPSDANMALSGVLFTAAQDPLDASNDVGFVEFGGAGTFVNVNPGEVFTDVPAFEGEKFRVGFDYLVPATTAMEPGEDTFWIQVAFQDPASAGAPQGAGNSDSMGFPNVGIVNDGVWRTIELIGTIPTGVGTENGSGGATISLTMTDDGFLGGPADTFGDGFYIDNIFFEAIDRLEGDFNNDGVVNALDYVAYRDNLGAAPPTGPPYAYKDATNLDGEAPINHNGDGMNGVDAADHAVFAGNYGAAAASSSAAIPEPGAGLIVLSGVAVASLRRVGVARRSEADRRLR